MVSQGKCRGGEGERSLGEKVAGGGRQTTTVGGRRWVARINREDYGSWTESNMKGESKQREGRNQSLGFRVKPITETHKPIFFVFEMG